MMNSWIKNCLFRYYELFLNRYVWHTQLNKVGSIGEKIEVESGFRIYSGHEYVSIGNRVNLADCLINAGKGADVNINDDVFFGHGVMLLANSHDISQTNASRKSSIIKGPINIEKGVWIASGAIILPGLIIGENAVVAAGSVVTKDVKENTLVGGVPAKKIRDI